MGSGHDHSLNLGILEGFCSLPPTSQRSGILTHQNPSLCEADPGAITWALSLPLDSVFRLLISSEGPLSPQFWNLQWLIDILMDLVTSKETLKPDWPAEVSDCETVRPSHPLGNTPSFMLATRRRQSETSQHPRESDPEQEPAGWARLPRPQAAVRDPCQ